MNDVVTYLPEPVRLLLTPAVLLGLVLFTTALFLASLIGVPWFLARMPADYFSRREQHRLGIQYPRQTAVRVAGRVFKNVLGVFLFLAGVAMLVLPGQGILTLFVSLVLLDFPGKRRFERYIISVPAVLRAINALRRRAGQAPLRGFDSPA